MISFIYYYTLYILYVMMERRGGKKLQHPDMEWRKKRERKREREAHRYMCTAQRTYRKKEMKKRMKIFFLK